MNGPAALAAWIAWGTLIAMEVVLGIDNPIFISILINKLPEGMRARARRLGIGLALGMRLTLLATLGIIVGLVQPVLTLFGRTFSWRDLILIGGGLFLVGKATKEIHHVVDPNPEPDLLYSDAGSIGLRAAIGQIIALDLVFSFDIIIAAVGITQHLPIMVIAVIVAVGVKLLAADPLLRFIQANPPIVMLAPGFLLTIGTGPDRRRQWGARTEGLYLFSHGIFGLCGRMSIRARRCRKASRGKVRCAVGNIVLTCP